jgi:predicted nucleotide-binding protein (sugar kinase/HSP70/actin superfamily)
MKRGMTLKDSFSQEIKIDMFKGVVVIDLLKKMLHHVRPYEVNPGETHHAFSRFEAKVLEALRCGESLEPVIVGMTHAFSGIPVDRTRKKKLVGIVGEIFVRQEEFINEHLIEKIENYGGEAWLMPLADFFTEGTYRDLIDARNTQPWNILLLTKRWLTLRSLLHLEHRLSKLAEPLLANRKEVSVQRVFKEGSRYMSPNLPLEDLPSLGRAVLFAKKKQVDLIINVKRFSCMPGNIVESISQRVQRDFRVPVLNIAYDGSGHANKPVGTVLENLK